MKNWVDLKVFPDLQDHLSQVQGQVQRQRQPGVGQEQGESKELVFGQTCGKRKSFFWSIGFLVTPRRKLHGVWSAGSGVINCQSHKTSIFSLFRSTVEGITEAKVIILLNRMYFSGPLGSWLPPEKDCMEFGPLGEELLVFKVGTSRNLTDS